MSPNAGNNDFITTPEIDERYKSVAVDFWSTDELEIDEDAIVSPSQFGAWVQAWVWVSKDEAEIEGEPPLTK
jgi:hypothetical protein